jgi:hypothetical protein
MILQVFWLHPGGYHHFFIGFSASFSHVFHHVLYQWPFQEPKLEVPAIYKV